MRKKQQSSIPDQDNDNVYEIKSILAYEKRGNEEYFLVEWDGYPVEDSTWEPLSNFLDPQPEICKRMEQLRKEAKALTNGTPATLTAGKRKRLSAGSGSTTTKRRRAINSSPSSAKSSANQTSSKSYTPVVEEPTSSSGEELPRRLRRSSTATGRSPIEAHKALEKGKRGIRQIKVKSIRRNEVHNNLEVILLTGDGSDDKTIIPVEEARSKHPQPLIDFLLSRIQFRGSSSRTGSPGA